MRPRRNAWLRNASLVLAVAGVVPLLAGCDAIQRGAPTAVFRPASPQASSIHDLAILLLIIAGIAFVIVEGWLLIAAFRFRNRPEAEADQMNHGNLKLEMSWTIVTAVIIFAVLFLTVRTMWEVGEVGDVQAEMALPAASAFPGDTLVMRVVGHQFWWTFEYPALQVVTGNEIAVPAGHNVKVQLEADDVIHSFWVPRLNGKTDTIPGQKNYTHFVATEPGVYHGICGEFCGTQHAHMGFRVLAMPAQEFSEWIRREQGPAAQPSTDQQRAGAQAFTPTCGGCHTVRGTAAQGKQGPDLTHFGSRQSLGADTLENTPENVGKWIRGAQEIKPGNKMPNFPMDDAALANMVGYLESLK